MRVTDYRLIRAESNKELTTEVQEMIAEGWEPQGGVTLLREMKSIPSGARDATMQMPTVEFFQAMVYREESGKC